MRLPGPAAAIAIASITVAAQAAPSPAPVAIPEAQLQAAFGNTIVSIHADGRQAKLWLNPDHTYGAQARSGKRSGGTWRIKNDKLCFSQTQPFPSLFSYCKHIPQVTVGQSWPDVALAGEPVTDIVVAGR